MEHLNVVQIVPWRGLWFRVTGRARSKPGWSIASRRREPFSRDNRQSVIPAHYSNTTVKPLINGLTRMALLKLSERPLGALVGVKRRRRPCRALALLGRQFGVARILRGE